MNISIVIKLVIAILLFGCLLNMPYGYYQLVRFIALVSCGILAFKAYQQNNQTAMVIYAALALLFQPFFKIALGRDLWNIVDVIIAVGLIISLFINPPKQQT